MGLELLFAALDAIKTVAVFASIGFGLFWLVTTFYNLVESDITLDAERKKTYLAAFKKGLRRGPWLIPLIILANIPSLKDLTAIRIELIKFNLASPENVERGTEEIARIAKKLECKYLGCDDDKKDTP